jgi:hypothetical protein
LVEHDLAKVGVAGSNPVFRSTQKTSAESAGFFMPASAELAPAEAGHKKQKVSPCGLLLFFG